MDCKKIDLEKTNRFSSFFLDYLNKKKELQPFYTAFPEIENFAQQIQSKSSFPYKNRQVLSEVLKQQYKGVDASESVVNNINLLKEENAFTITTGHQLNIFTGPLYFVYKIITVINTCKKLKTQYPDYNFIPVYWMASEDHDFAEINNFRFNGKKYSWQTNQKGAVGRFNPKELLSLINEIPGIPDFFKDAYKKNTLSEAVRHYVNYLFGDQGLVVLDADDKQLKGIFSEVIKDDILNENANNLVENTTNKLEKLGYKSQIFPREINFFYLKNNLRERIVKEDGVFKILNTELSFTKDEIIREIEEFPERFSPNVVLRPVYEEFILPNLAYCGGPAEVVYWLQLKSTFNHYKIPFPILLPRNFAMVISENIQRKMGKTHLSDEDIFEEKQQLLKNVVLKSSEIDLQLGSQIEAMKKIFSKLKDNAEKIDPTLIQHVEAQQTITQKRLAIIEKKFIRAEKRNQSDKIQQVESVLDFLFPNNSLQERTDNMLNFYLGKPDFINDLSNCFDPLDFRFHILNYDR